VHLRYVLKLHQCLQEAHVSFMIYSKYNKQMTNKNDDDDDDDNNTICNLCMVEKIESEVKGKR